VFYRKAWQLDYGVNQIPSIIAIDRRTNIILIAILCTKVKVK